MALFDLKDANLTPFFGNWKLYRKFSDNLYIMYRLKNSRTYFSPFYKFTVSFQSYQNYTKIQSFLNQYKNTNEIQHTSDKLKWYRYKKSMFQQDIADYLKIDRSTYIRYEHGEMDYYPIDKLKSIAELFHIDVTDLLDDYNRFLYDGQGQQIRTLRKNMGLTQYQFAEKYGINTSTVKHWENNSCTISKNIWEKIFNNKAGQ